MVSIRQPQMLHQIWSWGRMSLPVGAAIPVYSALQSVRTSRYQQITAIGLRCMSSTKATQSSNSFMSPLFSAAIEEAQEASRGASSSSKTNRSVLTASTGTDLKEDASPENEQASAKPIDIHAIYKERAEAAKRLPRFTTGNMRASPQKLNHLARLIRKMTIDEASRQMRHTLKRRGTRVAQLLYRIKAALRHNYNLNPDDFIIHQALVGKGTYLKRIRIHARGRFGVMHRAVAHIKIVLGPRMPEGTPKDKEIRTIAHILRHRKLYVSMQDAKPLVWLHPPWSRKPWKYVTSPRWTNPDRALAKTK